MNRSTKNVACKIIQSQTHILRGCKAECAKDIMRCSWKYPYELQRDANSIMPSQSQFKPSHLSVRVFVCGLKIAGTSYSTLLQWCVIEMLHQKKKTFGQFSRPSQRNSGKIIYHLKALLTLVQNQERNWAWHHSECGHAPLE